MEKLNNIFRINPLYEADGYKIGHPNMLPKDITYEYWHWIPRSVKYLNGINKVMSAGQQLTIRYVHSVFQESFFNEKRETALKFIDDMSKYLNLPYDGTVFEKLYDLGYLPIKIKAIPEGTFTHPNIPHMTGINTHPEFAWLGLFLETLISKLSWQMPVAATLANKFRNVANEWTEKTDSDNMFLTNFMCHDFHSRGGNPYTSIAVGLGHILSNLGTDTLNTIPASRYYYDAEDDEVLCASVNASEHSVTCVGLFKYESLLKEGKLNDEIEKYYSSDLPCDGSVESPDYLTIAEYLNLRDWLASHPVGILSVVFDTINLWKGVTHILPRLKEEILSRDGKLVIRPDSGDPVDIVCGYYYKIHPEGNTYNTVNGSKGWIVTLSDEVLEKYKLKNEAKGVVELLWDIFGGTTTKEGFNLLDSHIGVIYGDSINLDRQKNIYSRLADKNFASTNVVLGIGSYTYVYQTRDSAGFAAKGAWFELEDETTYNIYKDPITDDGTKKSLKGKVKVYEENGEIVVKQEVSNEEENEGILQVIYEDGKFFNQTTITEIRKRINNEL